MAVAQERRGERLAHEAQPEDGHRSVASVAGAGKIVRVEPAHRGSSGYRQYADDAVVTVTQIRKLLGAGLSTEEIAFMMPCVTGTGPDLEPCPELLDGLRVRLKGLDERIDTLTRSREALHAYIDVTERRART